MINIQLSKEDAMRILKHHRYMVKVIPENIKVYGLSNERQNSLDFNKRIVSVIETALENTDETAKI